ncbi:MAG: hypothetical protein HOF76_16405 [Candidatus Scalindua sp.]|jgi:hypothetical protein|nr:hypothetical protein [Candidatus Scalindua sp.]MBT5307659.1 hypothetical protein [Candidatus Scalindua sp.]MBT7212415.1 hypothetical protein [Candidatus Scalindua sp.]MBT7591643.1 hypothetical protein [Candidatus Scalindua sp.]
MDFQPNNRDIEKTKKRLATMILPEIWSASSLPDEWQAGMMMHIKVVTRLLHSNKTHKNISVQQFENALNILHI